MKYIIMIFLLSSSLLYADICGDISIGKDGYTGRGNIKIGYDFEYKDFILIPFIDYTNYFRVDSYYGHPFKDVFGLGAKLEFKDMYFMVKHECVHAVSSLNDRGGAVLYSDAEKNTSSTYITVGYSWGKDF